MNAKKIISRLLKGAGAVACGVTSYTCWVIGSQPDIIDSGKYVYLGSAAVLALSSVVLARSAITLTQGDEEE